MGDDGVFGGTRPGRGVELGLRESDETRWVFVVHSCLLSQRTQPAKQVRHGRIAAVEIMGHVHSTATYNLILQRRHRSPSLLINRPSMRRPGKEEIKNIRAATDDSHVYRHRRLATVSARSAWHGSSPSRGFSLTRPSAPNGARARWTDC